MDCFKILGIEPIKDEKVIKKAYAAMLSKYLPEDDPEGFQKVRKAFEEAIKYSKEKESIVEKEEVLSPIDKFMVDFEENYKTFEKRIDPNTWEKLLDRDICFQVDTAREVRNKVLTFIMDNYYFNYEVWNVFNEFFSWSSKRDELCLEFPKNFIDFVISNINSKNSLRYEILRDCKDNQDEFIRNYYYAINSLDYFDLYNVFQSIEKAKKICNNHPDLLILEARYFMKKGKLKEAEKQLTEIIEKNENDLNAYFYRGDLYFKSGQVELAYKDYKKAFEIQSDAIGTLFELSNVCISLEKYDEAIQYVKQLYKLMPDNQNVYALSTTVYNYFIDYYKDTIDNLDDIQIKYNLAEAYCRIQKPDESLKLLMSIKDNSEFAEEMHELLYEVYMRLDKKRLAHLAICEAVQKYPMNAYLNFLKGSILQDFERNEEAIVCYDTAIELDSTNVIFYNNKANALHRLNRYNEAIEWCNKGENIDPDFVLIYKNKAEALYGLQLYEDCLFYCDKCIEYNSYMIIPYIIKMKVFNNIEKYDITLSVFNQASECGLKDARLYLHKANALFQLDKSDEALHNYDLALELDDKNAYIYEDKGCSLYDQNEYKEAIKLFDKALQLNPTLEKSYYYKAEALNKISERVEALKVLDEAIAKNLKELDRYYDLKGRIHSGLSQHEEAINMYKKAIEHYPEYAPYYFRIASECNYMKDYETALTYINKVIEIDPSMLQAWMKKSYILSCLRKNEEFLNSSKKAHELDPKNIFTNQNLAIAYYRINNFDMAEKYCNEGLKIDPNYIDLLEFKYELLNRKNRLNEAQEIINKMSKINPERYKPLKAKVSKKPSWLQNNLSGIIIYCFLIFIMLLAILLMK